MKLWICLAVTQICLNGAFAGDTCERMSGKVDVTCEYTKKLTLISAPNKKQVDSNNCDAEYEKGEWQKEPTVIYPEADPKKTYVLLNIDPDPPAYEKGQYYLHWMVSDIKGEDLAKGNLSKANHLQAYYGPAPPAGSGLHRYLFLVFEDEKKKSGQEIETPGRRSKFELAPWLRRQENLCGPVAGIQFRTKF